VLLLRERTAMVNTLYLSAAGTASFDFRDAGNITSVTLSHNNAAIGATEVSFNSSQATTTNDTTGVIAAIVSTAAGQPSDAVFPMKEPVDVGERLFLHVTGANICRATVVTDATPGRAGVRRR
jgi:hypothetical protein